MKKFSKAAAGVIALTAFASVAQVSNANAQQIHKGTQLQSQVKGASVFTKGDISAAGSIVSQGGMTVDESGVTRGILELTYKVTDTLNINLGDQTYTYFKVPEEFYELMDTPDFTKYISGSFTFSTLGGQTIKPYTASDISLVGNHLIKVNNGRNAGLIKQTATSTIDINLGKAVTESSIRIPDAQTAYTFHGTTSTDGSFINWDLVGSSDAVTTLANIPSIDPGYGYQNKKPTVNDIYDTDKIITGKAMPGAKVIVYNNDNEEIGHGTALESGDFTVKVDSEYLPLAEYDEIHVTQNFGLGETNPAIVIVKHKENSASTNFKTGYWSDDQSYLALEGEFNDSSFDFSSASNTKFTLTLKDSTGVDRYSTPAVSTDFYAQNIFDGYQGLLNTSVLGDATNLPSGTYSISMKADNVNGTETSTMLALNQGITYNIHHTWGELESKVVNGRTVTFTVGPNGEALINIK